MKNQVKFILLCCFFVGVANSKLLAQNSENRSGKLVHTVFFKLKPEADANKMIQSLESLAKIEYIRKVEIGRYSDTGHTDILSGHTLVVQMIFDNITAFKAYESHPIHLASIKDTKELLAGPPIGYDYIVQ